MDPEVSAPATVGFGDEEWKLCCEDGFVYKRRKRRRGGEENDAGEASKPPDPEVDPAEEERNRIERKRRILVKLKRKYQKEIDHWEILSNTLCAMQEKANRFQTTQQEILRNSKEASSFPETSSSSSSAEAREQIEKASPSEQPSLLDELLLMEEAREGIIKNVTNVCEIAEEMCRVEEEEEKEMFFNLPVWGSPRDLMSSLCFDEI